jgi:NADH-ubiquinone oxidoreductase chain 5
MFMAGLGANSECHLREMIILFTLKQLCLLVDAVLLGFIRLEFFHLSARAFLRLYFLCVLV